MPDAACRRPRRTHPRGLESASRRLLQSPRWHRAQARCSGDVRRDGEGPNNRSDRSMHRRRRLGRGVLSGPNVLTTLDGDPASGLFRFGATRGSPARLAGRFDVPRTAVPRRASDRQECQLKRILIVLSEFGYWGEELVGPLETFDEAGYEVDFATPTGKRPTPLPPSMDPQYIDPPLGQVGHLAGGRREGQGARRVAPARQPDRPLGAGSPSGRTAARRRSCASMEAYYTRLDEVEKELVEKYDAILIVGGSGPIVDLANNQRVHDLILLFYEARQADRRRVLRRRLPRLRPRLENRESIISGKHVTGHCMEYDYKDGTGFIGVDLQHGPAAVPARVHPARRDRARRRVHRQRRPRDVGHRRLPVHHRPLDARLVPDRREDGRGARDRA